MALVGTEARLVVVEVNVKSGIPRFSIVGLPTRSVREAEQRTNSALEAIGEQLARVQTVANLAPGALRKEGTHFDLSLALGILGAHERIDRARLDGWIVMGELALDGAVRPVPGVLAAAITCRSLGKRGLICPSANAPEAALVDGIEIVPVAGLRQCIAFFKDLWSPGPVEPGEIEVVPQEDVRDVRGHDPAKRALEIAAAGGHNLMLSGPPGSGKTMLARRLPGILPPMSMEESLEVTRVYSVAGLLLDRSGLIRTRPFRTPHHHASIAGLVGGGSGLPRPGEVSLAHHGVLFLDELPLYHRAVLETLRGPLEDGVIRIARSAGAIAYPCRFSLIAAMNPCPCGYVEEPRRRCRCNPHQIDLYRSRLSGPLFDRFDMQMTMARLGKRDLLSGPTGEPSCVVRERVEAARAMQEERFGSRLKTNASVTHKELDTLVQLTRSAREMLTEAVDTLMLTGRGVARVMRVARTIADLAGDGEVSESQVGEALLLRVPDAGLVAA
ncbi:MAG: YifB family Mg chelatase-like AAA ATPase [Actinomycetota bacterium]